MSPPSFIRRDPAAEAKQHAPTDTSGDGPSAATCAPARRKLGAWRARARKTVTAVVRAIVQAHRGELDESDRMSAEAVERVETMQGPFQQGKTLVRRGQCWPLRAPRRSARHVLEEGIRRFEAKGATAAVSRVRGLLSQLDK